MNHQPDQGPFLAVRSYLLLFILDVTMSLITASIVYRLMRETKSETHENLMEAIARIRKSIDKKNH